jgi:hypothetical protein
MNLRILLVAETVHLQSQRHVLFVEHQNVATRCHKQRRWRGRWSERYAIVDGEAVVVARDSTRRQGLVLFPLEF